MYLTSTAQRAAINAATLPPSGRKARRPDHEFQLRHRPFQLQPFMVAPVLPGDTLENQLLQASALTDPIKSPLLGWWLDHFVFYVPFRAMDAISSHLQTMVLDPAFGELNAAADVAAGAAWYHYQTGDPSWAYHATKAVVEEFFRNDGEDWLTGAEIDDVPQIGLMKPKALESMVLDSASTEPDKLPGDHAQDLDSQLDHALGNLATDFAGHYDAYQALVAAKMVDVTYEDFLASYGVRVPHKPSDEPSPELLMHNREWKKPSRAVDETDGSIASAVSWNVAARRDKRFMFKEPGVILGLTCASPKVYLSKQVQAVIDSMKTALDWMPAVLADQAFTSLKLFTSNGSNAGNGPLGFQPSADYWIDLRDLMVNGDQFVNFALTETDAGLVALPSTALGTRFVSDTDVDNLFSAASPANKIRQDGVCRLSFRSRVVDMTP